MPNGDQAHASTQTHHLDHAGKPPPAMGMDRDGMALLTLPDRDSLGHSQAAQNKFILKNVLPNLHLHEAEIIGAKATGAAALPPGKKRQTLEEHIAQCQQDGDVARLLGLKSNATPGQIARAVRKELGLAEGASAEQVEHRVAQLDSGDRAQALGLNRNTISQKVELRLNLLGLASGLPNLIAQGKPHPLEPPVKNAGPAQVAKTIKDSIEAKYGFSSAASPEQIRQTLAVNLGLAKDATATQIQKTALEQMRQYLRNKQAIYEGLPTSASDQQIKQTGALRSHLRRVLQLDAPYNTGNQALSVMERQAVLAHLNKTRAAGSVQQGNYGDCYFVAAMASMANTAYGAKSLKAMIKTNADGSCLVTFPGDRKSPVTVSLDDLVRYQTQNATAVENVLETAFLKYDKAQPSGNTDIPSDAKVQTGNAALCLLTGKSVLENTLNTNEYIGGISKEELESRLTGAFQSGQFVTAGSDKHIPLLKALDNYPLMRSHQYSVLAFDPKTETVTMRNPWGDQGQTTLANDAATVDGIKNIGDGTLSISLDSFRKYIQDIDISGQTRDNSFSGSFGRGRSHYTKIMQHDMQQLKQDLRTDGLNASVHMAINIAGLVQDPRHSLQRGAKIARDVIIDSDNTIRHVMRNAAEAMSDELRNDWDMVQLLNPCNW